MEQYDCNEALLMSIHRRLTPFFENEDGDAYNSSLVFEQKLGSEMQFTAGYLYESFGHQLHIRNL